MSLSNIQTTLPIGVKLCATADYLINSSLIFEENNNNLLGKTVVVITRAAMVPVLALASVISAIEGIAAAILFYVIPNSDFKIKAFCYSKMCSVPLLTCFPILFKANAIKHINSYEISRLMLARLNVYTAISMTANPVQRNVLINQIAIGQLNEFLREKDNSVSNTDSLERVKIQYLKLQRHNMQIENANLDDNLITRIIGVYNVAFSLKAKLQTLPQERVDFIINQLQTQSSAKNFALTDLRNITRDISSDSNLFSDANFAIWQQDRRNLIQELRGQEAFDLIQGDPQRHLIITEILAADNRDQAINNLLANWHTNNLRNLSREQIQQLLRQEPGAVAAAAVAIDAARLVVSEEALVALQTAIASLSTDYIQRIRQFTNMAVTAAYHHMPELFSTHRQDREEGRGNIINVMHPNAIAYLTQYVELTQPALHLPWAYHQRSEQLQAARNHFNLLTPEEKRLLIAKIILGDEAEASLNLIDAARREMIQRVFLDIGQLAQAFDRSHPPLGHLLVNPFRQEYQLVCSTLR